MKNMNQVTEKKSLGVRLPTTWTHEKQRWEDSDQRKEKERKLEKRKSHKKDAKSGNMVFFQICGPGASKR